MAEQHLTKSELAIMEVMWEQEEALTASEIIKASGDKEWKNSSIHLMVNALLEKGFLEVAGFKKTTKNYARTFKPTMTKEKYFVRKVMGNTPVAEKKKIIMAEQHLTKSELAIMEVMWEQEEALTASEIIKASGDKEWKNSSIHLMVNALLEKGFLEVAGFKKTTKNYARTFKPTMTKEKYFVRKVMGNTPVAEKKKIYMQLLKEVDEIETLDTIKEEIYARKKELENR